MSSILALWDVPEVNVIVAIAASGVFTFFFVLFTIMLCVGTPREKGTKADLKYREQWAFAVAMTVALLATGFVAVYLLTPRFDLTEGEPPACSALNASCLTCTGWTAAQCFFAATAEQNFCVPSNNYTEISEILSSGGVSKSANLTGDCFGVPPVMINTRGTPSSNSIAIFMSMAVLFFVVWVPCYACHRRCRTKVCSGAFQALGMAVVIVGLGFVGLMTYLNLNKVTPPYAYPMLSCESCLHLSQAASNRLLHLEVAATTAYCLGDSDASVQASMCVNTSEPFARCDGTIITDPMNCTLQDYPHEKQMYLYITVSVGSGLVLFFLAFTVWLVYGYLNLGRTRSYTHRDSGERSDEAGQLLQNPSEATPIKTSALRPYHNGQVTFNQDQFRAAWTHLVFTDLQPYRCCRCAPESCGRCCKAPGRVPRAFFSMFFELVQWLAFTNYPFVTFNIAGYVIWDILRVATGQFSLIKGVTVDFFLIINGVLLLFAVVVIFMHIYGLRHHWRHRVFAEVPEFITIPLFHLLFIPILEADFAVLSCKFDQVPYIYLISEPNVVCWTTPHAYYAFGAVASITGYLFFTVYIICMSVEISHGRVLFFTVYEVFNLLTKLTTVAVASLLDHNPTYSFFATMGYASLMIAFILIKPPALTGTPRLNHFLLSMYSVVLWMALSGTVLQYFQTVPQLSWILLGAFIIAWLSYQISSFRDKCKCTRAPIVHNRDQALRSVDDARIVFGVIATEISDHLSHNQLLKIAPRRAVLTQLPKDVQLTLLRFMREQRISQFLHDQIQAAANKTEIWREFDGDLMTWYAEFMLLAAHHSLHDRIKTAIIEEVQKPWPPFKRGVQALEDLMTLLTFHLKRGVRPFLMRGGGDRARLSDEEIVDILRMSNVSEDEAHGFVAMNMDAVEDRMRTASRTNSGIRGAAARAAAEKRASRDEALKPRRPAPGASPRNSRDNYSSFGSMDEFSSADSKNRNRRSGRDVVDDDFSSEFSVDD